MTIKVTRPQIDLREEVNKALTAQTLENQDATVKSLVSKGELTAGGTATADQYLLHAIDKTKADSAVDVFVYDTRKDSDGGAWRKRTQNTSWYTETLNTSTRGSRKDFPAVAVIVAESNQITIYDGDDPNMPMWMVFETGSGTLPWTSTPTKVYFLNGLFCIGCDGREVEVNFISDYVTLRDATYRYAYLVGVKDRNDVPSTTPILSSTTNIINSTVNDLAMTVLPNAPIDSVTRLPIPTIAVATNGGLSLIKDDGEVVDHTNTQDSSTFNFCDHVFFRGDGALVWQADSTGNSPAERFTRVLHYLRNSNFVETVVAGSTALDEFYSPYSYSGDLKYLQTPSGVRTSTPHGDTGFAVGQENGLNIVSPNRDTPTEGLINYITSDYNTGWMPGDTKLVALSSTDDTNIDGTNLITGDAASDDTNSLGDFSSQTNGTVSINTNATYVKVGSRSINIIATEASSGARYYKSSFLTVGKTYVISGWLNASNGAAGSKAQFYVGGTNGASNYGAQDEFCSVADTWNSFSFTFTAETEHLSISFVEQGSGNDTNFYLDGLEVRLADENRSHYTHALQSNGEITKTPVAEGAELMAYSGFTAGSVAGNYLQQGFDTTHSIGTGDFYYSFWINATASSNETFLDHSGVTDTTNNPRMRIHAFDASTGILRVYIADGSLSPLELPSNARAASDTWNQVTVTRKDGIVNLYINGEFDNSAAWAGNMTRTGGQLRLGLDGDGTDALLSGSLSLLKYGVTAPTREQIKKIYNDEKILFQENAKATLYGSSNQINALAYDDDTELLHVGTNAGRSDFHGLRRVDNTTIAITTAISASNGLIAEE
jgi:hypothetical protein